MTDDGTQVIDSEQVAREWLRGLAARGIQVTVKNNRLTYSPKTACQQLTDDEVLTRHHHRDAIKELLRSGFQPEVNDATSSEIPS